MQNIRQVVGELFGSPMQNMSFVTYMAYVNTAGKITAKSLLDLITICLTVVEDQDKKLFQYEENFKEIQEILQKLLDQRYSDESNKVATIPERFTEKVKPIPANQALDLKEFEKDTVTITSLHPKENRAIEKTFDVNSKELLYMQDGNKFLCPTCAKSFTSKIALTGHQRSHSSKKLV